MRLVFGPCADAFLCVDEHEGAFFGGFGLDEIVFEELLLERLGEGGEVLCACCGQEATPKEIVSLPAVVNSCFSTSKRRRSAISAATSSGQEGKRIKNSSPPNRIQKS